MSRPNLRFRGILSVLACTPSVCVGAKHPAAGERHAGAVRIPFWQSYNYLNAVTKKVEPKQM